jgi:hypothetical protein
VSVNQVAGPQCFVEIYPFEGGSFAFTSAQIIRCQVSKNIRADKGTFSIMLPPNGPFGINAGPEWTRVLTPSSLVLIGITRGIYREVVMVGILRSIAQETAFIPDQGVRRGIVISGDDFSYYFNSFNWCSLSFLGGTAAALSSSVSSGATLGLPPALSSGLLSGPPDQVAENWYNEIMAGQSGILAQTQVKYGGQSVSFTDAMATLFEAYPGFQIPFGDYYIAAESTWMEKFRSILSFPWYEMFVITAPQGFYGGSAGGTGFTMRSIGASSVVSPTLVGRINPAPVLGTTGGQQQISFDGTIDTSKWDALTLFEADCGFIESDIEFDLSEVRNFYVLDPTWMKMMLGQSGSLLIPTIFSFAGLYDPDSIHRYGLNTLRTPIRWLSDLQGKNSQSTGSTFTDLWANLIAKLAAYYHPLPLMAKGDVKYPLRPDIIPGNRFTYMPFKSGDAPYIGPDPWDFYIEGVAHDFIFGGECTTTLTLCRGLPSDVYSDSELLAAVTQGTAWRINGQYQLGPAQGLQSFSIQQANDVMSQIARVWAQAQQN